MAASSSRVSTKKALGSVSKFHAVCLKKEPLLRLKKLLNREVKVT